MKIRAGVDIARIKKQRISHWVLTTAPSAKNKDIVNDFHKLRKRIYRKFGISLSYSRAKTPEGNTVLHVIVRGDNIYVPQKWLSKNWSDLHGSPYVYLKEAPSDLYRYVASQYVAGQPDPSFAYSRDWVYPGFWRDCRYLRNCCRDWEIRRSYSVGDLSFDYSPVDYLKFDKNIFSLLLYKNGVDPPNDDVTEWRYVPTIAGWVSSFSSDHDSATTYNIRPVSHNIDLGGNPNDGQYLLNHYAPLILGETLIGLYKKKCDGGDQ